MHFQGFLQTINKNKGNNLVCGIIINQLYNQLIIIYLDKLVVVKSFHFHYSIIGFVKYPMMTGSWHLYDATLMLSIFF